MPSSTVKTAPHFGHFTLVSLLTPAHPNVSVEKTTTAMIVLISLLIPRHRLPQLFPGWLLQIVSRHMAGYYLIFCFRLKKALNYDNTKKPF